MIFQGSSTLNMYQYCITVPELGWGRVASEGQPLASLVCPSWMEISTLLWVHSDEGNQSHTVPGLPCPPYGGWVKGSVDLLVTLIWYLASTKWNWGKRVKKCWPPVPPRLTTQPLTESFGKRVPRPLGYTQTWASVVLRWGGVGRSVWLKWHRLTVLTEI